jgi:hypothetical protein
MKSSDRSHSWLKPGLETRNTGTGQGVFATRCFGKDELLAIFGGHVMPIQEEPVFSDKHSDLALQIHDDFVLGPKLYDEIEEADFFNHSCDPNAGFRGQMFLVAMRNIEAGEQVCFDYGMAVSCEYHLDCLCGTPICRKIITGNDWQFPELQARYEGYFQWYLQEKINTLRGQ